MWRSVGRDGIWGARSCRWRALGGRHRDTGSRGVMGPSGGCRGRGWALMWGSPACVRVPPGLDLNTALGDLVVYNFTTNRWSRLELTPAPVRVSPPWPWRVPPPVPPKAGGPRLPTDASPQAPRHSHVAVCWRDALVLSGGELAGGALAHDVWVFDPFRGGWRELQPQNGTRPPGLAGHAAALVDDWLYIFGGGGQGGAGHLGSLRAVGSGGG